MASVWTRFSWWLWYGRDRQTAAPTPAKSLRKSSSDLGLEFRERKSCKLPMRRGSERVENKSEIDRDFAVVLGSSDGVRLSSDSSDSDWSIGWREPHSAEFDDESEKNFAVIVRCYRGRYFEWEESPKRDQFSDGVDFLSANSSDDRRIWNGGHLRLEKF